MPCALEVLVSGGRGRASCGWVGAGVLFVSYPLPPTSCRCLQGFLGWSSVVPVGRAGGPVVRCFLGARAGVRLLEVFSGHGSLRFSSGAFGPLPLTPYLVNKM